MDPKSKRQFKRMDDYLPFTFRVISRQEFELLKEKYLAGTVEKNPLQLPPLPEFEASAEEEAILEWVEPVLNAFYQHLSMINDKLDSVIALLRGEKPESVFLEQPRKINISGSGCRFESDTPLQEGSFVEIKIHLPSTFPPVIPALGKVVHVQRLNEKKYAVAVHFLAISYRNRETLVQYIFKRERALLRIRREQAASGEGRAPSSPKKLS